MFIKGGTRETIIKEVEAQKMILAVLQGQFHKPILLQGYRLKQDQ